VFDPLTASARDAGRLAKRPASFLFPVAPIRTTYPGIAFAAEFHQESLIRTSAPAAARAGAAHGMSGKEGPMANISRRNQGQRGEMTAQRRGPFGSLQDAFDNMFDRLMSQWAGPTGGETGTMYFWDFNVEHKDDEVVVRADMPGFESDDIEINLDQNVLTIQAQQRQQDQLAREFRSYYRAATLPTGVDPDKVIATYRNGVLEIHIPRKEEAKPRRIQVHGQSEQHKPTGQGGPPASAIFPTPPSGTAGQSTGVPSGTQGKTQQGRDKP
jgi:HSP20 family protein